METRILTALKYFAKLENAAFKFFPMQKVLLFSKELLLRVLGSILPGIWHHGGHHEEEESRALEQFTATGCANG